METRIEIQQYIPALQPEWDCFIANSRNGTFLFFRNYMDYHSDRFIDNSLLFRYKGKLIAVLPANREGDVLWSHQGLTYGGLVLSIITIRQIFRQHPPKVFQIRRFLYNNPARQSPFYSATTQLAERNPARNRNCRGKIASNQPRIIPE